MLKWLKRHYKRGQQQVHSPDPDYASKREQVQLCVQQAREHPDEVVTLFEDEFSFYRWPTVAPQYAPAGRKQPVARLTPGYNNRFRVAAAERLGIRLIPLPIYAPWLNPTEKVGHKLRQEIIQMHPFADQWPRLRQYVGAFLDQYASGSQNLLRYVGLLPG